jgi:hypothetical protein
MLRRAFSLSRLGATAGVLLIASLLVAPDATAAGLGAPSNLDPNGPVASTTPTFSWNRVSGATGYEFQLDDSDDFSSTLQTAITVNDTYVPTLRLKPGTVYWRVRATGPLNARSPWSTASIDIDETAAPSPISPVNGAELGQPDSPALLQWSAVAGAVGYQIEVDAEGDWVGTAPNYNQYSSPGPTFQVPVPQAPQPWHWRVRADLGNGSFSRWSEQEATYRILPLADVTRDPSMEIGGTLQDVILKWLPVPGATKYEVQVGLDNDFTQPVETKIVLSTRYSPVITYDNDQYFWRVRANDAAGNKMDWPQTPYSFHRDWPDRPELVWPPDQLSPSVGDPFYFQWEPVAHATRYQLDVGTDPNFSPSTYVTCRTAGTTFTAAAGDQQGCMPGQGPTTYWRVKALDSPRSPNVEGIYSEVHRFTYNSGIVPLLSPADGASVAVPTLRWAAVRDAYAYAVQVRDNANSLVGNATTNSLSWTPSGTALDPARGPFTWTVQAVDFGGGKSPAYDGRTFTLDGTPPTTGADPLTPDEIAAGARFPSLEWEPVTNAKYYRVRIGVDGSNFWDNPSVSPILATNYPYPAATDIGEHYLIPGTYMWQVQAVYENNTTTPWGPTGTFEIKDLPAVTGQRIALDGRALDDGTTCDLALGATPVDAEICLGVPATPVLDWAPVPDAGLYMVYLANDRELTNRLFTGTKTSNTRWTPNSLSTFEALADNQSGEAYYWYIRPCKTQNVCAADPVSTDAAATNAFRKISPQVQLLPPGANSVNECTDAISISGAVCSDDIAFSWEDYYTTNQERTFAGGATPSPQTAMKYRIEFSTSESFGSPLHYQEVDQPTYTLFSETLPEGDVWWRVQAIDARGNRLAWSDKARIRKDSGRVALTEPVAGDVVSGATPFSWEPAQHAAGYRIEVYKNDDATFSPANLVFAADTKLASYVWSKYLPPSATPYRWRVRSVDANANPPRPGQWSLGASFRVSPGVVELTGPAANSVVRPNGPVFSWQPVGFAVKYKVEARLQGGTAPTISVTTPATSHAATQALADGAYEWRVSAYDTSNGTLAASAWRPFSVDTLKPRVTKKTPAKTAKPTSNFVVTFSEPVSGVTSSTMRLFVDGRTTAMPAKVTLSANRRVATLNPTANLKVGKKYRVRLTSAIKDPVGNQLAAYTWAVAVKR